jgi:hypothetical protein
MFDIRRLELTIGWGRRASVAELAVREQGEIMADLVWLTLLSLAYVVLAPAVAAGWTSRNGSCYFRRVARLQRIDGYFVARHG